MWCACHFIAISIYNLCIVYDCVPGLAFIKCVINDMLQFLNKLFKYWLVIALQICQRFLVLVNDSFCETMPWFI